MRAYAKANREKVSANKRRYYLQMRDDPHFREMRRRNNKRFYKTHSKARSNAALARRSEHHRVGCNHTFRMGQVMRGRLTRSKKVLEETGLTVNALRAHMAAQFTPEMTWDNYGSFWSVDHRTPKKSFNLAREEDRKVCFHWTNLRPLPVTENINNRTK